MTFEQWLTQKKKLLWLQPDSLLNELTADVSEKVCLPEGCHGAIFIWDPQFFAQAGIGRNRQVFLEQALESIGQSLGDGFLLIEAVHQEALKGLLGQSIEIETLRSPLTEPLFAMTQSLMATPVLPGKIHWRKSKNWIDYPFPLPNGFFKFWKHAEKSLFTENPKFQRAHKPV